MTEPDYKQLRAVCTRWHHLAKKKQDQASEARAYGKLQEAEKLDAMARVQIGCANVLADKLKDIWSGID